MKRFSVGALAVVAALAVGAVLPAGALAKGAPRGLVSWGGAGAKTDSEGNLLPKDVDCAPDRGAPVEGLYLLFRLDKGKYITATTIQFGTAGEIPMTRNGGYYTYLYTGTSIDLKAVLDAGVRANYNASKAITPKLTLKAGCLGAGKIAAAITITSSAPGSAFPADTYTPTATSTSGNSVSITVDPSSSSVCTINGSNLVTFTGVGTCTLNFNDPGNANYSAAPQVQQSITVSPSGPPLTVHLLGEPNFVANVWGSLGLKGANEALKVCEVGTTNCVDFPTGSSPGSTSAITLSSSPEVLEVTATSDSTYGCAVYVFSAEAQNLPPVGTPPNAYTYLLEMVPPGGGATTTQFSAGGDAWLGVSCSKNGA